MHNLKALKALKDHPSKCCFVIGEYFILMILSARLGEINKTNVTLVFCIVITASHFSEITIKMTNCSGLKFYFCECKLQYFNSGQD